MTLLLTVLIMLFGLAYLSMLHSERRFSGVQERSMQAWYLAESGRDYVKYYCRGGNLNCLLYAPANQCIKASSCGESKTFWARVSVPPGSVNCFFEIVSGPGGTITVRGIVRDTLSNTFAHPVIERSISLDKSEIGG